MKKIMLFLISLFIIFSYNITTFADETSSKGNKYVEVSKSSTKCKINTKGDVNIENVLDNCKPQKTAGKKKDKLDEKGIKNLIFSWVKNIGIILSVLTVGMFVYAGLMMQFSGGSDEKINKAKDMLKWTTIGFLLLISASIIIYVIVNFMYGFDG